MNISLNTSHTLKLFIHTFSQTKYILGNDSHTIPKNLMFIKETINDSNLQTTLFKRINSFNHPKATNYSFRETSLHEKPQTSIKYSYQKKN
jgi:hypothetical protein